jgi:hypothetical protein
MDQNPEDQITPNEPLFENTPAVEPIPDPSPSVAATEEQVVAAADQVIDVPPPAVEEPSWATVGTPPTPAEPPLKPEILGSPAQPAPKKNSNGWVIALVVLLVLCCCCIVFLVPALFLSKVFVSIFSGLSQAIIDILNSIFNGTVRFY